MRIEELPSFNDLRSKLDSKYSVYDLTSMSEKEKEEKIWRLQRDLKIFVRTSGKYMEQDDLNMIATARGRILMLGTFTIIPCFYLSFRIDRRSIYFRNLSYLKKLMGRTALMGSPILLTYYYSYNLSERIAMYLEEKYAERVQEFKRTKDPKAINPNYEV